MNGGLLDPLIVGFVFAPLFATVLILRALWRKRMQGNATDLDAPGWLLASAARALPEARIGWGAAMSAELAQVGGWLARWRFALGCVRVALFPPFSETLRQTAGRSPLCGLLAVALPPLGLPMIYFAALIMENIGGSPYTQSPRGDNPDLLMALVRIFVLLTFAGMAAGLPLGLAGWLRRERLRSLSATGMILSVCILGYFLIGMHFLSGGE